MDTSVWIDFFRRSNQPLIDKLDTLVENNEVVALSCVFGELLQGVKNGNEKKIIMDFWGALLKVDESGLFIDAGKNSIRYKLHGKGIGLIDSYILSASLKYNLSLWTFDKKLNDAYNTLLVR